VTKTERVEIDGHTYLITQLPGFDALETLGELSRTLGPGLVRAAMGALAAEDKSLLDADVGALAVPALFAGVSGKELRNLTERLLKTVELICDDKKRPVLQVFDVHFQGRTLSAFKLLWAALKVSFGDFRDAVPGLAALATATASRSQST
jgi:hypothetical protein